MKLKLEIIIIFSLKSFSYYIFIEKLGLAQIAA